MKILVIKPSSLGDVVHALPAVSLVHRNWPEAEIAWLVNDELVPLVERFSGVSGIIPFRRRRWARPWHWLELPAAIGELRRQRFDLTLDFQGLLRSGLMGYLSGAPRRIGFAAAREGATLFYTAKIPVPPEIKHAVDRNLHLVRAALGITGPAPETNELRPDPVAAAAVASLLARSGLTGAGPLVAVAPAARWPSKRWPPAFFTAVIRELRRDCPEARIWLAGSRAERPLGEGIVKECADLPEPPRNLMGSTGLSELLELLRQSRVLLTNDSGPLHLAAAVNCPTVALFGPTAPELTGPYGKNHTVFRGNCPHSPCFKFRCPLQSQVCIRMPAPEAAAAAIMKVVG